jgi:dihydroorotate dehydrogenase
VEHGDRADPEWTRRAGAGGRLLRAGGAGSYRLLRPLLFAFSAQRGHEAIVAALAAGDRSRLLVGAARRVHRASFRPRATSVGGVALPHPFILAAGLVKGLGFDSEEEALDAVRRGRNIIPGWRAMPALVGPVEMGSFTRRPRLGNPAPVVWRDPATRSTQNRVGLRNPGAAAAAAFLAERRAELPPVFGINIASSPGVGDPAAEQAELVESLLAFVERGVRPSWFTLNLSCPNTEDEPARRQTAEAARALCSAAAGALRGAAAPVPLWVKIGPDLPDELYRALLGVFAETGVRAVVATNTLARPSPVDPGALAGVGGGELHRHAVRAVAVLADEKRARRYPVDLVGSGGVEDAATAGDFTGLGARAVQYWSAIVFRGPLAAALILDEIDGAGGAR